MENRGAAGKTLLFLHVADSSDVHRGRGPGCTLNQADGLSHSLSTQQMVLLVEKDDVLGVSLG